MRTAASAAQIVLNRIVLRYYPLPVLRSNLTRNSRRSVVAATPTSCGCAPAPARGAASCLSNQSTMHDKLVTSRAPFSAPQSLPRLVPAACSHKCLRSISTLSADGSCRTPTSSRTPTAATALPYVITTKRLERCSSADHRRSDAGGAPSHQLEHRGPAAPLRVTSSSHSPTFVSRAIGTGPSHGLVGNAAQGTTRGLDGWR